MTQRIGEVGIFGAGELTLSGDVVLMFAAWMKDHRDKLRNGGRNDPDVERWATVGLLGAERTLSARTSDNGTSELPITADPVPVRMLDPVDTQEAALILGRTPREVIRLIRRDDDKRPFPSAQMLGGRYLIERSEVLARMERTA